MEGADEAYQTYNNPDLSENDCYKYAAARNALYRKNKTTEIMVNYEPGLHFFTEWWKQLYGESEGKDQKDVPAGVDFILTCTRWTNASRKQFVFFFFFFFLCVRLGSVHVSPLRLSGV